MNTIPVVDCQEMMDRLDSYLDGDLDAATSARLESHLEHCPDCTAEHRLATAMQGAFRSLTIESCPEDVFERAIRAARKSQDGRPDRPPVPSDRRQVRRRWRPLALVAATLMAVLLASLPFVLDSEEAEFSAEEIARARADLELALSLVSEAGRETGAFLQQDVLIKEFVQPVDRTIPRIR